MIDPLITTVASVAGIAGGCALTLFAAGRYFGKYEDQFVTTDRRLSALEDGRAERSEVEGMKKEIESRRREMDARLETKVHINDLANLRNMLDLVREEMLRELTQLRGDQKETSKSLQELNSNIGRLIQRER